MNFSNINRASFIQRASTETFDLLVIGGGITGCGIALDASLRGIKVALIEKKDFASGTSSRSTKLIHGGLRYLKQLELKLVHDVGTERATVHNIARHVVIPEKMLLPIYKDGTLGTASTSLALLTYDLLAGVKSGERRKMLSVSETLKQEPLLSQTDLLGGGLYFEYRTDDARLVIELAKSAFKAGGLLLNYTELTAFNYDDSGKVCGAQVLDNRNQSKIEIRAKTVVNACGPWVDLLRKADQSLQGKRLQLTKGVHLVFPFKKIPLHQAAYFDVGDGRMIFAIPRDGVTYVGTTDTIYNQSIDNPVCTTEDAKYLLNAINHIFPSVKLGLGDIESTWAGLRPLIQEDGKAPGELSRKDEIFVSKSGLISIAGGKLTGYRLMSEKIVDLAEKKLGKKFDSCTTAEHLLSGGEFSSEQDFSETLSKIKRSAAGMVSDQKIDEWFYRYGTNTSGILELVKQNTDVSKSMELMCLEAELHYAIESEMVLHPSDFLERRTGKIFFDRPGSMQYIEQCMTVLSAKLQMTEEERKTYLSEVVRDYQSALACTNA